jgi:hypothetical protein
MGRCESCITIDGRSRSWGVSERGFRGGGGRKRRGKSGSMIRSNCALEGGVSVVAREEMKTGIRGGE